MVASKNIAFKALLILLMASCTFLQGSEKPQEESIFSRGWRSLSEMGSKIWQSPYSYYTATPLALYAAYKLAPSSYLPDKKTLGLLAIPAVAAASYYGPSNAYTAFMNKIRGQTTPTGEEQKPEGIMLSEQTGFTGEQYAHQPSMTAEEEENDKTKLEEFAADLQNLKKTIGAAPFVDYKTNLKHEYSRGGFDAALGYFHKVQKELQSRYDNINLLMDKKAETLLSDQGFNEAAKKNIISTLKEEVFSRVKKGSSYSAELGKMESTLNDIIESSKQAFHQPIDRSQDAKLKKLQEELLNLSKC